MKRAVLLSLSIAILGLSAGAGAQSYPSKPLRMVVGFPAGGPVDIVARLLAAKLSDVFGQQVLVDNRGGANGMIATEFVAKSAPDGYTMMLISTGVAINPSLYPKMAYDTLRDLQPVTLVTETPELLVVHPSVPAKSIGDLIALAKARPGQLSVASTGSGGIAHLTIEMFKVATKIDLVHIPYKGAAPAIADLIGGQISGLVADLPVLLPQVQSGRLRALGVASAQRSALMRDVPTLREQGQALEAFNWYGIIVAAKTPPETISRLREGLHKALNDPDLKEKLVGRGADPIPGSTEQFASFLRDEIAKWGRIIKASGAKAD